MHVALLNPVFWPEVRRGSERVARELADGLIARGHRVTLITGAPGRGSTTIEDGLEVVRVARLGGRRLAGRLDRRRFEEHLTHLPLALRALRRADPDVAHALYPTDALAALRWKQATGRPVVFSYMGIPHHQSLANRRGRKEIVLRASTESDAVVALSQTARAGFQRWLGVDPEVIAPPVDVGVFSPGAPEDRDPAPLVLCAADHTQPRKRVGVLAHAVAQVDGARLAVSRVRDAPAPAGALELDLDDRAALAAANRRAHVHALPSEGEAFGLVLAEALACGTPVVGSQPEVAGGPDTGRVVSGEDAEELAAALREAIALAARGQETIDACRARAQRWSTDACVDAYESLYARVLGEGALMLASAAERIARELPDGALVLDVGGWASPYPRADWVLDLLPYETRGLYGTESGEPERFTQMTWVQRDICDRDPWPFADDHFDFAVCAHTLEDVRDPVGVCRELSRVAKAGYVEVPAPQEELRLGVHGPWVGWSHHHWICETDADGLVFTFKPHLLTAPGRHLPADPDAPPAVLQLWWTDAIAAREQVLVGAEPFDAWLAGLLDRYGPPAGPAKPPRRRFRR